MKFTCIKMILAVGARLDLELHQMNVVTAFLNGDVEKKVYMEIPEGAIAEGQDGLVCRHQKALYDLTQAPKRWNDKINPFLVCKKGFRKCDVQRCLYP